METQKVVPPFVKSLLGASVPSVAESDLWPTLPSREQRGYQECDHGGDHYYVRCRVQSVNKSNTY